MSKISYSKNIYLQAKRASKVLDVPLTKAKDVVAKSIYHCHDFQDLERKFEQNSLKSSVYPFCQISPSDDKASLEYLKSNIEVIGKRLSKLLVKPISYMALTKAILRIFGFKNEGEPLRPPLYFEHNEWRVASNLDENETSVYFKDFYINDVPFRLLAINVITECSFDENSLIELRELHSELIKFPFAPIKWRDCEHWQQSADIYLKKTQSGSNSDVNAFGKVRLPMNAQQAEFQKNVYELLETVEAEYRVDKVRVQQISSLEFYFIGYPIDGSKISSATKSFYLTEEHIFNNKCIFAIGDGVICLELFEHNNDGEYIGEDLDYYQDVSAKFQQFYDVEPGLIIIEGKQYSAFLRSCIGVEFERYYNMPLVLIGDCTKCL